MSTNGLKRQITLDNGWLVDIVEGEKGGYTIEKVQALFGHGVYHPIDTEDLTDDEWYVYHQALIGGVSE